MYFAIYQSTSSVMAVRRTCPLPSQIMTSVVTEIHNEVLYAVSKLENISEYYPILGWSAKLGNYHEVQLRHKQFPDGNLGNIQFHSDRVKIFGFLAEYHEIVILYSDPELVSKIVFIVQDSIKPFIARSLALQPLEPTGLPSGPTWRPLRPSRCLPRKRKK